MTMKIYLLDSTCTGQDKTRREQRQTGSPDEQGCMNVLQNPVKSKSSNIEICFPGLCACTALCLINTADVKKGLRKHLFCNLTEARPPWSRTWSQS